MFEYPPSEDQVYAEYEPVQEHDTSGSTSSPGSLRPSRRGSIANIPCSLSAIPGTTLNLELSSPNFDIIGNEEFETTLQGSEDTLEGVYGSGSTTSPFTPAAVSSIFPQTPSSHASHPQEWPPTDQNEAVLLRHFITKLSLWVRIPSFKPRLIMQPA